MQVFRVLVVFGVAAVASAQLSAVFDRSAAENAAKTAEEHLATSASGSLAPRDTFYSSLALSNAGAAPPATKPKAACTSLKAAITAESGLPAADLSFAVRAAHNLGCLKKKWVSDAAVQQLRAALTAPAVADVYAASEALAVLAGAGVAAATTDGAAWADVVTAVSELMESNGLFRDSPDGASSALAAGHAFHVLAAAWDAVKDDAAAARAVKAAVGAIGPLLQSATGPEDGPLALGDGEDKLLTTSVALTGAMRLAAATNGDVDVVAEQLAGFGAFFLQHRFVSNAAALGQMVAGLHAVASNSVAVPLAVTLPTTALAHGSSDAVVVRVTDVLGNAVEGGATVLLESATRVGDSVALVSDIELDGGDAPTDFTLKLMAAHPAPGVYELQLSVSPGSSKYGEVDGVQRMVQVSTALKLTSAHVQVTGGAGGPQTATATFPAASKSVLTADRDAHLNILFETQSEAGDALRPHQAFVRLTHADTGVSTMFVAAPESSSTTGSHRLSLNIGNRDALHEAAHAGTYAIDLIIGDVTIHNPAVWRIGSVQLSPPPPPPQRDEILYTRTLMYDSDTTLKALPEIHHQFRTPDSRPPTAVSRGFTLLTVAPLALLWIGLLTTGANLQQLFSLPAASQLWGVLFHGSFAALLGLVAVYWLQLNMFQFLVYMCVPAGAAIITGHRLFKALHAANGGTGKVHVD